jgi:hypothetical protein
MTGTASLGEGFDPDVGIGTKRGNLRFDEQKSGQFLTIPPVGGKLAVC